MANGNTGNGGGVSFGAGEQDVAAIGLTVNNSSGEAVDVAGFSGTLSGSGDFDGDITGADVYIDANGNGAVDAGEATVPATVNIDGVAGTFVVTFTPSRSQWPAAEVRVRLRAAMPPNHQPYRVFRN